MDLAKSQSYPNLIKSSQPCKTFDPFVGSQNENSSPSVARKRDIYAGISHLDVRISSLAGRLDKRIDLLADRLDKRIDLLGSRIDQRIDGVTARFDSLDNKIDIIMHSKLQVD
ncbi:hypothetical protein Mgra_00000663 [Meloidogyne graminicola]|uniref:t-SNARE coiled-coil homology domain-containing protein n=1 Tax=Meloidogyne graminicola TaxID=189291 RepID=A0A8T0A2G0_9BILA|nr:hypothetical protein Mgra_00000663 [Meloidogyne graminicola]